MAGGPLPQAAEIKPFYLRLKQGNKRKDEIARPFDYEYYALAQIADPRVIEVYDYGADPAHPYYTVESLDGGDLRELAPFIWKKACSLMNVFT
jgi:hypothetical protein